MVSDNNGFVISASFSSKPSDGLITYIKHGITAVEYCDRVRRIKNKQEWPLLSVITPVNNNVMFTEGINGYKLVRQINRFF